MKQFSQFKIQIKLPCGTKQIVWEKKVEGDISIDKEMEAQVKKLKGEGEEVVYAKRAVFGSEALFN